MRQRDLPWGNAADLRVTCHKKERNENEFRTIFDERFERNQKSVVHSSRKRSKRNSLDLAYLIRRPQKQAFFQTKATKERNSALLEIRTKTEKKTFSDDAKVCQRYMDTAKNYG